MEPFEVEEKVKKEKEEESAAGSSFFPRQVQRGVPAAELR